MINNNIKHMFTEEEFLLMTSFLIEASGGVPKTDAPKDVYELLKEIVVGMKKKDRTKRYARVIIVTKAENEILEQAIKNVHMNGGVVGRKPEPKTKPILQPIGELGNTCPNFDFCEMAYKGCRRTDDTCPDKLTLPEIEIYIKELWGKRGQPKDINRADKSFKKSRKVKPNEKS